MSAPVERVNKFGQISSDDHQVSVMGDGVAPCLVSGSRERGYPCTNASWVMITKVLPQQNDRQTPVKTFTSCNFICRSRIFLRGVPTPKVGVLTYYFAFFFCRKLHENEKIWTRGGGGCGSLEPPWIHQCVVP